jgi:hypothetical protein
MACSPRGPAPLLASAGALRAESGRAELESQIIPRSYSRAPAVFAELESAGGASIRDEPLHFLERLNPGHLLQNGLAPWTANCVLLHGVRLECHRGVYLNVNFEESSLKTSTRPQNLGDRGSVLSECPVLAHRAQCSEL